MTRSFVNRIFVDFCGFHENNALGSSVLGPKLLDEQIRGMRRRFGRNPV